MPLLRWLAPTLLGVGAAALFARQRDRYQLYEEYSRHFVDSNSINPVIIERIKFYYGREFAAEAEKSVAKTREVLYKKSTARYWFSDPMSLLGEK